MTLHIATVDGRPAMRKPDGNLDREAIVKRMAEHIVAGVLHARLDTSCEQDIIRLLYDAPDRFHYRIVLDHMDDALFEAKQSLIAMEVSKP
jgi:hypothetical protein